MVEITEHSVAIYEERGEGTSVRCHCGVVMELRVEGVERTIPPDNGPVEFRGYICPACGSRRRYEYEADDDAWRPVDE